MHPDILSGPILLLLSVVGFAWPLVAGLAVRPVEKIVAGCVLSLLCIGLFAWAVYTLALPPTTFWLVPAFSAFAILYRRHAFITTLRDAEVRALLVAQLLVTTAIISGLFSIVSYSGGGWASDWFEHWDRAQFFLNHAPLDHRFLGHYALPARPPLANLVTGAFLTLGRVDFAHYQLITALLSSLAFLPAALVAWRFGGRPAIAVA